MTSIRRAVGVETDTPEAQRLDQRVRLFLVDNERGKKMSIRLGANLYEVGTSGPDGHFQAELAHAGDEHRSNCRSTQTEHDGVLAFSAVTQEADERSFTGRVQFVPPQGLSIISDIDDTIKHTQVRDRTGGLGQYVPAGVSAGARHAGTLSPVGSAGRRVSLRVGQSLAALPAVGRVLRRSSCRWVPGSEVFPAQGSVGAGPAAVAASDTKIRAIEPILKAFPQRRFVLIGDSGEQDPEIYTEIARTHRPQIVAIFIRNVTQEQADNARIARLRPGLDGVRFHLFDRPTSCGRSWRRSAAPASRSNASMRCETLAIPTAAARPTCCAGSRRTCGWTARRRPCRSC